MAVLATPPAGGGAWPARLSAQADGPTDPHLLASGRVAESHRLSRQPEGWEATRNTSSTANTSSRPSPVLSGLWLNIRILAQSRWLGVAVFADSCWRPRALWPVLCSSRSASLAAAYTDIFRRRPLPGRPLPGSASASPRSTRRRASRSVPGHGRADPHVLLSWPWPRCCKQAGLDSVPLALFCPASLGLSHQGDTAHDHRAVAIRKVAPAPERTHFISMQRTSA